MQNPTDWSPSIPLFGCALALVCLLFALRSAKRFLLVSHLPTSRTKGVFIGLVELKGTAETTQPLRSYLAECSCVQYAWTVEEHWERNVLETYRDGNGRTRTRTRTESGWMTIASGGETMPFFLRDDCGEVLMRPEGARLEPDTVFSQSCGAGDALYFGKGPEGQIADSTRRRRFTETAIPLHAGLYVIGQARERSDAVAPEIAAHDDAPMFLVSSHPEEHVSARLRAGFWLLNLLALAFAVGGFALRDHDLGLDPADLWPRYVAVGAGYVLAGCIGWGWMLFNSLIDLRQRVRQGWAQVDVQLKRRHDLIPNLVAIVAALQDYERKLQTQLAELRAQQSATAPGQPGADFHGLARVLSLIAERYPEIRSQESFAGLQRELIDTEQRIALARDYFNEIATHYNTRIEIIPDRFIATLARMRPRTLMGAEGFERAAPDVAESLRHAMPQVSDQPPWFGLQVDKQRC